MVKQLELQLQEMCQKLDDSIRHNNELNSIKNKIQSENSNLLSQLEESESHVSGFAKVKQQLQSQMVCWWQIERVR